MCSLCSLNRAELNAVIRVFPTSRPALCLWHVERNLFARYRLLHGLNSTSVMTPTMSEVHKTIWSMGHARLNDEGLQTFVDGLCRIFELLGCPTPSDPRHTPAQLAALFFPGQSDACRARIPSPKQAKKRGKHAGSPKAEADAKFWDFLCQRLFLNTEAGCPFPDRAQRLFPCISAALRGILETVVLLTNNHLGRLCLPLDSSCVYRAPELWFPLACITHMSLVLISQSLGITS